MDLKEIRLAYREIVTAYNEAFPSDLKLRTEEDITQSFDKGDESLIGTVSARFRETNPKLRAAANQSGNARVWQRGEPLDGLNEGMRERIEKAMRFGI